MAELTDAQKVLRNDTGKRIAEAIEALGGTPPINLGMTGATPGQVPVINTVDSNGAPTSYRPGSGGGGGTSDYTDLTNKPSINNVTLSGNKTAADLGLGTYTKPSGGIPASDLSSAVLSPYRTAAAQDEIDATQDSAIGVVITGNRPSRAVSAGQYVMVKNSTISGITDGLYTTNAALSPSVNVTAANLSAVLSGGLNMVAPISLGGTGANTENQARVNLETAFVRRFLIGASQTMTLSCRGVQAFLLVMAGTTTSRHGLYIVSKVTSDEASPLITSILGATAVVISTAPASITFVNGAGNSVTLICITTAYNNLPTEA